MRLVTICIQSINAETRHFTTYTLKNCNNNNNEYNANCKLINQKWQKYILLIYIFVISGLSVCNLHYIHYYAEDTKQSFYIICKGKIDEGTKPFSFSKWYVILIVCVPQSRYEFSITWRWYRRWRKQLWDWEIPLKNFLSATVEQLCLLAKLWSRMTEIRCA